MNSKKNKKRKKKNLIIRPTFVEYYENKKLKKRRGISGTYNF